MFQYIIKTVDSICLEEEVFYLINGIKAYNDESKMGKTYRIGLVIYFEAALINISNCLSEVQST